ncbi:MAG: hypothetical protein JXN59_14300 [Anaerolineae bacterium]|nr:hypothetical protein [Anaerolineae bacterium]
MTDLFRVGATGFVWVVFTVFMFGLFSMASDTYDEIYFLLAMAITGTLALFAFMLTSRIWRGRMASAPAQQASTPQQAAAKSSKTKRKQVDDRLERLMDELGEDELIELETLLQARAEDVPPR